VENNDLNQIICCCTDWKS